MWRGLSLLAAAEAGVSIKRRVLVYALYAAAGLVALIGVVFALVALQIALTALMRPSLAALSVAGLLVLTALVIYLAAQSKLHERRAQFPLKTTAFAVAPSAMRAVSKRISMSTVAVLGVVVLGALVGRQISRGERVD